MRRAPGDGRPHSDQGLPLLRHAKCLCRAQEIGRHVNYRRRNAPPEIVISNDCWKLPVGRGVVRRREVVGSGARCLFGGWFPCGSLPAALYDQGESCTPLWPTTMLGRKLNIKEKVKKFMHTMVTPPLLAAPPIDPVCCRS